MDTSVLVDNVLWCQCRGVARTLFPPRQSAHFSHVAIHVLRAQDGVFIDECRGGQGQNVWWNYTSYFHPTQI